MRMNRRVLFVALFVLMMVLLAGCGPRLGAGDMVAAAGPSDVAVDLPAIYIDYDAAGNATVGGRPISDLGSTIGMDLSPLNLGQQVVGGLTAFNIQHIQVINTAHGLDLLVNGRKIPSLGWDAERLSGLSQLTNEMGLPLGGLERILPLLGKMGFGAVLRFPIAEGGAPLPLVAADAEQIAADAKAARAEFLTSTQASPAIQFTVDYGTDGKFMVDGMGSAELGSALGIEFTDLDLGPETIQGAVAAGLKTLSVSTSEAGILLSVNGVALPTITWADGELENIWQLATDTGLLQLITGGNESIASMLPMVKQLLPTVEATKLNMVVNFPAP